MEGEIMVNTLMKKCKKLDDLNWSLILENAYLFFFGIFILYSFLGTTTFNIKWHPFFEFILRFIMMSIILIRYWSFKDDNKLMMAFVFVMTLCFLVSWYRSTYGEIMYTCLMILGAKNISFKKLIAVFASVCFVTLIVTMGAALTGHIKNLIYYRGTSQRIAFGICYPTDFSAHVFYLILCYWYLRGMKLSYVEIVFVALLGVFVYVFCNARLNTICIFFASFVMIATKILLNKNIKKLVSSRLKFIIIKILTYFSAICAFVIFALTYFFNGSNKLLASLNLLLNNRLVLGKMALTKYGITKFGQEIFEVGAGGTTKKLNYYFYIDSSYIRVAIKYGLLVFILILSIMILINYRSIVNKDWVLLAIMGLVAIQCIVEQHLIDISYNPFLWALLASFNVERNSLKQCTNSDGR